MAMPEKGTSTRSNKLGKGVGGGGWGDSHPSWAVWGGDGA